MYADYHGLYGPELLEEDPKEDFVVVENSGPNTELTTTGVGCLCVCLLLCLLSLWLYVVGSLL